MKKFFSTLSSSRNPIHLEKINNSLDVLIQNRQKVREWTKSNRRTNGSMLPHEFKEYIPPNVGVIHINATRNNTHCVLTDSNHKVITNCSAGMVGLKGAATGSPEGGTRTGAEIAIRAKSKGISNVFVNLKGFGTGRDPAFRSIMTSLNILRISDKTPIAHGGCRAKKQRRV